MFSIATLTTQLENGLISGFNLEIERLNQLLAMPVDENRKQFYTFLNGINLKERLFSLGYAAHPMNSNNAVSDRTKEIALKNLNMIADDFSSCSLVIAFPHQMLTDLLIQISQMLTQIDVIPNEMVLTQEAEDGLKKIKQELQLVQKHTISAMKIYLNELHKENNQNPDLLTTFINKVDKVITPLRDQRRLQVKNPTKMVAANPIADAFLNERKDQLKLEEVDNTELSDLFIEAVYMHGNAEDREYLFSSGIRNRSKTEQVAQAINFGQRIVVQAVDGMINLRGTLADLNNARLIQNELTNNISEKLRYVTLNHLADYDRSRARNRFGNDDLMSFSMTDYLPETTAASEAPAPVVPQLGYAVEHVNNLHEFYQSMELLASDPAVSDLDVFQKDNLRILHSLCNRLQDADNNQLYTESDIATLVRANELRAKALSSKLTMPEINEMKEGLRVKAKHEKYRGVVTELDSHNNANIFNKLRSIPANAQKIEAINKAQADWMQRSTLAAVSSESLLGLEDNIAKIERYAEMLKCEFSLHRPANAGMFNQGSINIQHQKYIAEIIQKLEAMIKTERKKLVDAMLAKMSLIPKEHLVALTNPNYAESNEKHVDDVVFATLKSLMPFGLSASYINNFELQAPVSKSLTDTLIGEFNDYASKHGNREQLAELNRLYTSNTAPVVNERQPDQLHETAPVLIPTRVVGHYQFKVQTESNDLGESVILIEIPAHNAATEKAEDVSNSRKLSESGLGTSFYYTEDNKRIYFPSGLCLAKVDEGDIEEFYDLLPAVSPESDAANDFEMILKDDEIAHLQNLAKKYFRDQSSQSKFVDKMIVLLKIPGCDVQQATLMVREVVANAILENEIEGIFAKINMKARKQRFANIAKILTANYLSLTDVTHTFEASVIDKAFDFVLEIESHAVKLKNEMNSVNMAKSSVDTLVAQFTSNAYQYLERDKFTHSELAKKEAELDVVLTSHSASIAERFRETFVAKAKAQVFKHHDWCEPKADKIRINAINKVKAFFILKDELKQFLTDETVRIKKNSSRFVMSKTKTDAKLAIITAGIESVENAKDVFELNKISSNLLTSTDYTQKRGRFSFFGKNGSAKDNLRKFITEHPMPAKRVRFAN